ncbi:MAG: ABC transporter ATP-binding protein [Gammaproteobacteria bacterium HGW-Gammaproteobacteria-10]|nr:MAG: ABC transporter ATP-binding protein [Gammaproteobacteria bacterium HGW-Gammaproteobacteria-10]
MNAITVQLLSFPPKTPDRDHRQVLLRGQKLTKNYTTRYRNHCVFEDIDIMVNTGEIVCLLGASGCGKSTLLMTLAGLQGSDKGQVDLRGEVFSKPHPKIGLVFQEPCLLPWLSVAQNAAFGLKMGKRQALSNSAKHDLIIETLRSVGLDHAAQHYPHQLSGGMAQRVALARALVLQPQILLLDEPFSALDAITRLQMQQLLLTQIHRRHCAALLVTHDIDEALLLADRIILMGGTPGRLLRTWSLPAQEQRLKQTSAITQYRIEILEKLNEVCSEALSPTGSLN